MAKTTATEPALQRRIIQVNHAGDYDTLDSNQPAESLGSLNLMIISTFVACRQVGRFLSFENSAAANTNEAGSGGIRVHQYSFANGNFVGGVIEIPSFALNAASMWARNAASHIA